MHPKRAADPSLKRPTVRHKELDAMIKAAWKAGWFARRTGQNYVLCYPPDGTGAVRVVSTPSSQRTIKNTRAAFREYGLDV